MERMNTVLNIHTDNHNSLAISTEHSERFDEEDTFDEDSETYHKEEDTFDERSETFHRTQKHSFLNENIKREFICECDDINWVSYNELQHNLELCKSCYCKFIRDEISHKDYEDKCCMSFKNSGRKFKDICMVAT